MSKKKPLLFLLPLFVAAFMTISACSANTTNSDATTTVQTAQQSQVQITPAANEKINMAENGTLAGIYDRVNPSVVYIEVEQQQSNDVTSLFQFPDIPGFPNIQPQAPDTTVRAEGSGFVWDTDGHIVTNNHVVANADKIMVAFSDDKIVPATLVGADPDSDLAVISVDIDKSELHPVQVADSSQLHVGDLAIAIGNPFGQEETMTVGIISALGRLLPVSNNTPNTPTYNIPDIIQTDASINPGNSGGVLLNDQGQVVGVTSAIISPAGASAGVGFAIPSTIVQDIVPVLITDGHYNHPYLGISGTSLTPDLADAAGLPTDQTGALVGEVSPNSPADEAGLRGSDRQVELDGQQILVGGDVITAIDNQPVHNMDDLITYIYSSGKIGETVTLTILRDGNEQTVDATLQARPQSNNVTSTNQSATNQGNNNESAWLGISGVTLNSDLAQAMDLKQSQEGVLIEQIEQGSPADEAGLQGSYKPANINGQRIPVGGDVIIAANGETIHNTQDIQSILNQASPGDKLNLTIIRDGNQQDVSITLGQRSN